MSKWLNTHKKKDAPAEYRGVSFMVTRTGIEPMLPP